MGVLKRRYTKEQDEEFKRAMLEMIPDGALIKEMAECLGINEDKALKIKKKLINEGKTSQAEIDAAVEARMNRERINRLLTDPDIKRVKEGLLAGLSYAKIAETVRFSKSRIAQLEVILEEAGLLNKKKVDIARKNRDKLIEMAPYEYLDKKRFVLQLLNIGISTKQIRNITGITLEMFNQMKQELIEEGETSDESIKGAVEQREKSSKDIVEKYIKQGFNYVEIAEKIPYADRVFVERLVNVLKTEGRVKDEEIIEGRQKREEQLGCFIVEQLNNGMIPSEIAETEEAKNLKLTEASIRNRINKLRKSGNITKEDEARFNEARKTMQERNKTNGLEPYDERIIILTELGFNSKEIGKVTGIGKTYFFTRKRILVEKGLMKEGKKGENTTGLMRAREKMADTRRDAIEKMISFDRDIDSSIVNNHIEYAKAMFGLGQIEMKDMNLISTVIPMEYQFISLNNINFVIKYFNDIDCLKQGIKFINECLASANDMQDKKRRAVNKYKRGFGKDNKRKSRKKERHVYG